MEKTHSRMMLLDAEVWAATIAAHAPRLRCPSKGGLKTSNAGSDSSRRAGIALRSESTWSFRSSSDGYLSEG